MIGRRNFPRRPAPSWAALTVWLALVGASPARAGDEAAAPAVATGTRRPFPTRDEGAGTRPGARGDGATGGTASWWLGTVGIALALAGCGWISLAARRLKPGGLGAVGASRLRVVGRASLSPRHWVYLLQAGDRVLIVGTGPQGAPALLGEMPASEPEASAPRRFDHHVGDEA